MLFGGLRSESAAAQEFFLQNYKRQLLGACLMGFWVITFINVAILRPKPLEAPQSHTEIQQPLGQVRFLDVGVTHRLHVPTRLTRGVE